MALTLDRKRKQDVGIELDRKKNEMLEKTDEVRTEKTVSTGRIKDYYIHSA